MWGWFLPAVVVQLFSILRPCSGRFRVPQCFTPQLQTRSGFLHQDRDSHINYHVSWRHCSDLPGPLDDHRVSWPGCVSLDVRFVKERNLRGGLCTSRGMKSRLIGFTLSRGELAEQLSDELFPPWSSEAFREVVRDLIQPVGIGGENEQAWKLWAVIFKGWSVLFTGVLLIRNVFSILERTFEFKQMLNYVVVLVEGDGKLLESFSWWGQIRLPNLLLSVCTMTPWLWDRELLLAPNNLQDKMFLCQTCDACVYPCIWRTNLLHLHISEWRYGEVWKADQGLSVLQPSDVALAEVAGWAAKDHSCPGEKVGVTSHHQV